MPGLRQVVSPNGFVVGDRVASHLDYGDYALVSPLGQPSWFTLVGLSSLEVASADDSIFGLGAPVLRWCRVTRGQREGLTARLMRVVVGRRVEVRLYGAPDSEEEPARGWVLPISDVSPIEPEGWARLTRGVGGLEQGTWVLVLFGAAEGRAECAVFTTYGEAYTVLQLPYRFLEFGGAGPLPSRSSGLTGQPAWPLPAFLSGWPVDGDLVKELLVDSVREGRPPLLAGPVRVLFQKFGYSFVEDRCGRRGWVFDAGLEPCEERVIPGAFSRLGEDVWDE